MTAAVLKYDEIEQNKRTVKHGAVTYSINLDPNGTLWEISTSAPGPVPRALQQRFTTPAHATVAIKNYLDTKKDK